MALNELLRELYDRCQNGDWPTLPSEESCICGGDPHEGRACGQGACECPTYELQDPKGHDLKKRIEAELRRLD